MRNCSLLITVVALICASCATNQKITRYPTNSLVIRNKTSYEITVNRWVIPTINGCVILLAEGGSYPTRHLAPQSEMVFTDFRHLPERINLDFSATRLAIANSVFPRVSTKHQSRTVDVGGRPKIITLRKFWDF